MKCLTLIIHQAAKQNLVDLLLDTPQVQGFTVLDGEGHSNRTHQNPFETARDKVMGYVPRVRVDVLLEEPNVQVLLDHLRHCDSCVAALGIWWVTEVVAYGLL